VTGNHPGQTPARAFRRLFNTVGFADSEADLFDPFFGVKQEKKSFSHSIRGDGLEWFVGLALQFRDPSDDHISVSCDVFPSVCRPGRLHDFCPCFYGVSYFPLRSVAQRYVDVTIVFGLIKRTLRELRRIMKTFS